MIAQIEEYKTLFSDGIHLIYTMRSTVVSYENLEHSIKLLGKEVVLKLHNGIA